MIKNLTTIINHFGKVPQSIQAIEEMSELTKVITKDINRNEPNKDNYKDEIADVYIMLYQLMIINELDIKEVMLHAHKKIEKTIQKIKQGE